MTLPSRRSVLASTAAALASAAGCLGETGRTGGTTVPTTATTASTGTGAASGTGTVTFSVPGGDVGPDDETTVLPPALRELLVDAARTGETVRGYDDRFVIPPPTPFLHGTETLDIKFPGSEAPSGTYTFDVASGARYEMRAAASRVDSVPDQESATPVGDLDPERRTVVEGAVDGDEPTVYPETELGTWFRESFIGGYFLVDGQTYRGHEVQQTDAGFFSETVWYVLQPSDQSADEQPTTLRLPDLSPSLLDRLESVLPLESGAKAVIDDPSDELARLAAETDLVATHTVRYRVSMN
ncbi:hypothetical protein [Haloarchaeobius sp. TZWSO28]|uniref:hypothetical protein n=1 Tax=Haloarchaeobius sp. TZWSO28 TaxID=3446119 RepID=UPI003EBC06DB